MRDLGDLILYIGAVAAALAAIGVLLRWVAVRPLQRLIDERVRGVQVTADQVHAEVSPNHGHSLKDAVNRTEVKVNTLSQRLDDHLINHPRGQ